jgi:hypothetical protein
MSCTGEDDSVLQTLLQAGEVEAEVLLLHMCRAHTGAIPVVHRQSNSLACHCLQGMTTLYCRHYYRLVM